MLNIPQITKIKMDINTFENCIPLMQTGICYLFRCLFNHIIFIHTPLQFLNSYAIVAMWQRIAWTIILIIISVTASWQD